MIENLQWHSVEHETVGNDHTLPHQTLGLFSKNIKIAFSGNSFFILYPFLRKPLPWVLMTIQNDTTRTRADVIARP